MASAMLVAKQTSSKSHGHPLCGVLPLPALAGGTAQGSICCIGEAFRHPNILVVAADFNAHLDGVSADMA